MKQRHTLSILGTICLITSHSLALILIGWYLLIQIGIIRYDQADLFSVALLLTAPSAGLLFSLQLIDQVKRQACSKLAVWGCIVSGLMVIVSGIAWVDLIRFFSGFNGVPFH